MKLLAIRFFPLAVLVLAGCARFEPHPISPAETSLRLESRSLADTRLRAFVETNLHHTFAQWPPPSWRLDELTLAAFFFQPELDIARAQWRIAEAAVQTAGGRPNPVLSAIPGYSINPAKGVSSWFPAVSLDIPVETAGKRSHRIYQANHLSEAARLNIASIAWQVRSNVRSSLLDFTMAQRRAELLHKQVFVEEQIVGLLEQRLQAGAIARNELMPPRIALIRANSELADATRQSAEARVRIAEAIGVPVKALDGAEFEWPLDASTDSALTSAEARQQALLGRPDILAALAEYAASESALQLEIAKQYPDVHLSPGYQYDQGESKWSLGLSVELPVLNRNQGPIAEACARREESSARFVALQARVIAEIDRAQAAHAAALDQLSRQRPLAQLAGEQRAAVESQFKAGAADKLDLGTAQLEISTMDLANLDAQVKAQQAIAQLEAAIRRPLESWPEQEQGRAARLNKP